MSASICSYQSVVYWPQVPAISPIAPSTLLPPHCSTWDKLWWTLRGPYVREIRTQPRTMNGRPHGWNSKRKVPLRLPSVLTGTRIRRRFHISLPISVSLSLSLSAGFSSIISPSISLSSSHSSCLSLSPSVSFSLSVGGTWDGQNTGETSQLPAIQSPILKLQLRMADERVRMETLCSDGTTVHHNEQRGENWMRRRQREKVDHKSRKRRERTGRTPGADGKEVWHEDTSPVWV